MRAIQTALFACILLSLAEIVKGDLQQPSKDSAAKASPPKSDPPGKKSADPSSAAPVDSSTVTITASIISATPLLTTTTTTPLSTTTVQVPNPATTITTIDVSSFMTSSAASLSTSSRSVDTTLSLTNSSMTMPSGSAASQSTDSISHQTLVILSAVLGSVGLIFIAVATFLIHRLSRGRAPFGHRDASPINDDEIESWRRSGREKQLVTPPDHGSAIREVTSIPMHPPTWTWVASPTSIRTVSGDMSEHHSVLAKAPNARIGLTDDTLPGEGPFITPPKRQSSRLSKAHPGHARTKSRRSSMSAKSMWSGQERSSSDLKGKERQPTWHDEEDENTNSYMRTDNGSSSPGISDFFDSMPSGGLSPRPKSQPRLWEMEIPSEDIGRAIA